MPGRPEGTGLTTGMYDTIARHYDAVTGDSSSESVFVDSVVRSSHPHPVTLLEVACGTGGIMASLAGRYTVAGLDISPGMLAVARAKLPPGTPLHLADMSRFELHATFDAVVCVYHGVNHLLSFAAWEGFFDCAHRHLNDAGVLVFDIMTIGQLMHLAGTPPMVQESGGNCLRIRVRLADRATFDWNIELLEAQPGGSGAPLAETIRTTSFSPARIRAALAKRFAGVTIVETDGAIGDGGEKRIWFVCTKRHEGDARGGTGRVHVRRGAAEV